MATALEIIAIGRTKASRTMPYFRSLLLKLVPTEKPGLGTLGVTANAVMFYDPAFIERLSPEQMEFALLHEVMHLMMNHHSRCGSRDSFLWNLAGDLFINPQLLAAGLQLPMLNGKTIGILPTDAEIMFPPNLMAEEYYEKLVAKKAKEQAKADANGSKESSDGGENEGGASGDSKGEGDADSDSPGGEGSGEGSEGGSLCSGHCGSAAGHAFEDEPTGKGSGERSEASLENTRRVTAEAIKQQVAQKGIGSVPGGLARWADVKLGKPQVRWQAKLAKACRRIVAYRPGGIDYRYSRPSRRQAAVGYGPGRPILPSLVSPIPRVAFVLDTSGSMGTEEIAEALSEATGILKAVGAEVEFVACDSSVHVIQKIKSAAELKKLVKGGGGTNFIPAFEALQKRKDPPEVVIFATDGCGPAPAVMPRGMQVIWLLLGPYKTAPCSWGEQIEIK